MRIITRREPKDPVYRFDCGHCGSTLECEKRELTPVGFINSLNEGSIYAVPTHWNYICPVCGSSEVIGEQFLKEVER